MDPRRNQEAALGFGIRHVHRDAEAPGFLRHGVIDAPVIRSRKYQRGAANIGSPEAPPLPFNRESIEFRQALGSHHGDPRAAFQQPVRLAQSHPARAHHHYPAPLDVQK